MKGNIVLLASLLVLHAAPSRSQQEWSEWRGPDRAGRAADFGHVKDWPAELELVWSVPVGLGHSAPVVANGMVCLHSRTEKNEVVSCHDLATGAKSWSRSYPAPFNTAIGGGHHGAGPKATLTLRDGRLFTFGISGVLSAWNVRTGELMWRRDFREEHKKPWPRWGVAASPLLDQGRVYVHVGRKDGTFLALNADSGEEIWRLERFGASYGSPVVVELDGVRQIVTLAEEGPLGVNLEGELLWRFDHKHNQNIPSPVVIGENVLLSSKGRPTRALSPRRNDDRWSVSVAWKNKEIPLHMSTVVAVNDDRFCGFTHRKKGFAFCAQTATGKLVWQSDYRFSKHASVVSVPGALLYFTPKGRLRVLEDGDAFRELASYEVAKNEVWAHPAVLTGALIVKSEDELLHWRIPRR